MSLLESIKMLPAKPGIYQYFNENGKLLYVGKAKDLSKRVKSYFYFTPQLRANPNLSVRIQKMLAQTVSLNYIVVNSEHDALILENSLIKQLKPKYNILLRDDKTYPYIYLDRNEKYPRFEITRKVIKDKNILYHGPYSVGARDILDSLYELTKLVQKKSCLKSHKLCLYYQIKRCLGPCELNISQERYAKEVEDALAYIENKSLLVQRLQERMLFYAESERFEEAAELRDRIERIDRSQIKTDIDLASDEEYDIFAAAHNEERAVVVRIFMRKGRIISSSHDFIQLNEGYDEDEIYQRALLEFYQTEAPPIIAPILVACEFEGKKLIEEHLSRLFGRQAQIRHPKRGNKKELIALALLNANELLRNRKSDPKEELLTELKKLLHLNSHPERIEVFDNSHLGGVAPVGSMIVYEAGGFSKEGYRRYHLEARDEYSQMREMLTRRIESFEKNPPPDLWVLDGGATLLQLACELLDSHGVNLDVIAISKEKIDAKSHRAKGKANDILHTLDESFKLANSDKRLQFVQMLRDEAHRTALKFHKESKVKLDQESLLLTLKGISHAKIKKLLNHLGSFEAIKTSTFDELAELLNAKDAKLIKNIYK
ncbi:MAG: excinuclease ABC subunit UvrC [Epsilonproteobacteria bacterium]|nr:excinuclease ABC subunit UvrC [Campylobacterota bacterium]